MVALTGLVLLLGGGYAVALRGSGTLQKENERSFVAGTEETIRVIKGIGPLRVTCATDAGALDLSIDNNSGEGLRVHVDRVDSATGARADPHVDSAVNGGSLDLAEANPNGNQRGVLRAHVFPTDGSKRPQVDATIGYRVGGGDCANAAQVSILDLTTEE
jgi:hypothetical protein